MKRTLLLLLVALVVLALVAGALLLARGAPELAIRPQTPVADADYRVYFTSPRFPDDPGLHHGGPDEALVALLRRATRTLDVAVYDFDLENVARAMAEAAQRGVRVRMVTDSDTLGDRNNRAAQAAFRLLKQANVPIVDDRREAIMHHKFTVVDGEWVATGSMNYTDGDAYRLNNNLFIVHSRELADNYTAEFEKLFLDHRFGPAKRPGVPHPRLQLAGHPAENYFAPQDKVASHVVDWIGEARRSIHFLAFAFTHDGIGQAMLERARAGVAVQGVFETTGSNTPFSEYTRLKRAGIEVLQDGNPYPMHHKVILIDGERVIFGSFNFSQSADEDNDENLLMVEDSGLAAEFEAEYQRVLATARNPPRR